MFVSLSNLVIHPADPALRELVRDHDHGVPGKIFNSSSFPVEVAHLLRDFSAFMRGPVVDIAQYGDSAGRSSKPAALSLSCRVMGSITLAPSRPYHIPN